MNDPKELRKVGRMLVPPLVGIMVGIIVARLFVAVQAEDEAAGLGFFAGVVSLLAALLVSHR